MKYLITIAFIALVSCNSNIPNTISEADMNALIASGQTTIYDSVKVTGLDEMKPVLRFNNVLYRPHNGAKGLIYVKVEISNNVKYYNKK